MKELELARSEYQQALQFDAQNGYARLALAGLHADMGESQQAELEATRILQRQPRNVRARLILAAAQIQRERLDRAREVLKPLGNGAKLPSKERLQLARLYRRAGDAASAAAILEALQGSEESRASARAELVQVDVAAGRHAAALERLNTWIADEPDDGSLYFLRARVRMAQVTNGALSPEIGTDLQQAIAKGASGVDPQILLSTYHVRAGQSDQAVEVLKGAQKLAPRDTRIPLHLAAIYERAGKYDEAREAYESILRVDQNHAVAKNNLAWLIASAEGAGDEELERALQLAQDAKDALPTNPSVADTLGWVMLRKDIPQAAITLFREAIEAYPEADPRRGTVRYHLAMAYERNGQTERAIDELRRALDESPNFTEREATKKLLEQLRSS